MNVRSLGQVADIERDGVDPNALVEGTPYLGMENVTSDGELVDVRTVAAGELDSAKFTFGPEHILFGKLRPYLKKIAQPGFAGICSTELVPIRPKSGITTRYLYHFLRWQKTVDWATSLCAGANLPRLNPSMLATLPVPVPELAVQEAFATTLDHLDSVRRKQRQALALIDELVRATFLEMFGDPVANPRRWGVARLGEVGVLDRGKSQHRPRNDPALLGGAHPLIQTGEVANSEGEITTFTQTYSDLGLAQSRIWPAGTLCITIAATIAKTGVLKFDACFPDSVVGFRPAERATTEFVQAWLFFLQPIIEARAPQVAQRNINLEILRELELPVPPIEMQRQFARHVMAIREAKRRLLSLTDSAEALFASLQDRAFAGSL